jgi:hypothetical protein
MNGLDNLDEELNDIDIAALDFDTKIKMLERIAGMMLSVRLEYARKAGELAEIRANLEVLKQVKSALQSAIKAEME